MKVGTDHLTDRFGETTRKVVEVDESSVMTNLKR